MMILSRLKEVHRYKVGGASLNCINFVVPMNVATPKLIQWKNAIMRGKRV